MEAIDLLAPVAKAIDSQFGAGYAAKNPSVVVALLHSTTLYRKLSVPSRPFSGCADTLITKLADGDWHRKADVIRQIQSESNGAVSRRTIERAAKTAGVETRKAYGGEAQWRLLP